MVLPYHKAHYPFVHKRFEQALGVLNQLYGIIKFNVMQLCNFFPIEPVSKSYSSEADSNNCQLGGSLS